MAFTFDYISRSDVIINTTLFGVPLATTYDDTEMRWNATAVDDQGETVHSNAVRTSYENKESNDLTFLRDPQPLSATTTKVNRFKPSFDNDSTGHAMPYRWPTTIMDDFQLVFSGGGEVQSLTQTLKRIFLRRWPGTVNGANRGMTVELSAGAVKTRIEEDTYGYGATGMAFCIGQGAFFLPPYPYGGSAWAHPAMDRVMPEPDLFGLLSGLARHRTGLGTDDFRLMPITAVFGGYVPYSADGSGNFFRQGGEVELWSQCPSLPPGNPFSSQRFGFQPFWGLPPSVAVGAYAQYSKFEGEPAPVCVLEIYLEQQLFDGSIDTSLVYSLSLSTYPVVFAGPNTYGFGGYFETLTTGTMLAGCTSFRYRSQIVVDGTTGPTAENPFKPNTSNYPVHHKIPPSAPWGGCSGQGEQEAGPIPGLIYKRYPAP